MTSRFGPLLRQLRRRAGMTQEQLAERSGVGVRTIRRLENNSPTDPRIGTVKLLADALDLSPDEHRELLAEVGSAPAEEPAVEVPEAAPDVDPPLAPRDALTEAADQLAQAVAARWQREAEQRRIHDPFPLPVRWQPVSADLTDHPDNIHRVPPGSTADPLDLTGDLTEIADVYRRIPSGRLAVLGRAGSGKTILALRFTLDHLRTRAATDPVPVIFSVGSWDPTATALRDWLIDQLSRDYPGLVASAPNGSTLAAALVETGRVLPVLDGFDEIAHGLHRSAVEALNTTALPLLLTSRPGEYAAAVEATALAGAAGVELVELGRADLINYLPRTARRGTAWDSVLDELRERPDSEASANLAAVLSTPLMVGLVRTVYGETGEDPADLLDTDRFPTPAALEDHLLSSFVPAVYRPRPSAGRRNWDPDRARHWLGYLADNLDRLGTGDLKWWLVGGSLRRSSRILAVVLASAFVTAVVDALVFLPSYAIQHGIGFGIGLALLDGLMTGTELGLAFGLLYGLLVVYGGVEFEPSRMRVRLLGKGRRTGRRARTAATRFGAGLLGGFVVALGYAPVSTFMRTMLSETPIPDDLAIELTLVNFLVFGLIFGLALGTGLALVSVLETPLDINSAATPIGMLAANRSAVVRQTALFAPLAMLLIAIGGRLVVDLFQGSLGPLNWPLLDGLVIGAVGGTSGAIAYAAAFTAWGQWVLLARVWLPLTGRLPWQVIAFLDDAYDRGVLRQAGAVHQFRHARLQAHLGRAYRAQHATPARLDPATRTNHPAAT
ncbi:helix-turn-helix domain-containing protein [Saccharopolyspora sp. NPDC050642]|uniref:helix-turn-helix domain-containing protein n=1 Tax=Saccharopolyspora sp. NPDC050642 TaxID=3157099 RepID=UPI0033FB46B9